LQFVAGDPWPSVKSVAKTTVLLQSPRRRADNRVNGPHIMPHRIASGRLISEHKQLEKEPMADHPNPPPPAPPAPDPRAISQIRLRIATNFYDRPDVVRETVSRMLQQRAFTQEP
jgi:hypothetical protein